MVTRIENYIGGELRAPHSDQWLDDVNPTTGELIARVPDSDEHDVADAVAAAESARGLWSRLTPAERGDWLTRLASRVEDNADELAQLETLDTGKPYTLARSVDIPRASSNLRFFASCVQGWSSHAHVMPHAINYTLRQPIGIVGCISPWNLPLYLFTWKIAPALATGNCVIAKPSELTPITAHRLSQFAVEVGLPAGVLNIIHGRGLPAGEAMVSHPAIRAISFTGGTATGRRIASLAAPLFKRLSLEMGGKNPVIIFADCDYQRMLDETIRSSFSNQGQICLCGSRILIEESLYARFRDDLVQRASILKVVDPLEQDTNLGAVITQAHQQKILGYIDIARQEGGRILHGGHAVTPTGRCRAGYFVAPTIIENLGPRCRTNQEEIFGPVVTLQPFQTEQQALELANASDYGLAASVWTSQLDRALRLSEAINCGVVWVNCWLVRDLRTPFGGMKQSGVGREGGEEALRFFTEAKNVCMKSGE
jgi:aminomuconate-semialdehyde/2-hydroxymuconate-6-semialdehyde dehydrogenase